MINRIIPLVSSVLPLFPYVLNYVIGLVMLFMIYLRLGDWYD